MVEQLDSWIHAVGPLGYLVLALSALVEYVFPPFPGDTVVLLGGIYAVRGEKPWALVLAVVTLGSVAGAAIDFLIGRRLVARMGGGGAGFAARHPNIARIQARMQRSGDWIIALNRFVPGVRGLLFVAAGAAGLHLGRVLALGTLSALVWNGLLFGAGFALGGNAERLERLLGQYQRIAWGLLVLGGAVFLVRWLWGRRREAAS